MFIVSESEGKSKGVEFRYNTDIGQTMKDGETLVIENVGKTMITVFGASGEVSAGK